MRLGERKLATKRVVANVAMAVAAVGFTTVAYISPGVSSTKALANDGVVWTTNDVQNAFGALNFPIRELNSSFARNSTFSRSGNVDVIQNSNFTVGLDYVKGSIFLISSTTDTAIASSEVELAGGSGALVSANANEVISLDPSNGQLRLALVKNGSLSLASLSASAKPLKTIKNAVAVAVGTNNEIFIASSSALLSVDPIVPTNVSTYDLKSLGVKKVDQLTTVGSTPAVLDSSSRVIALPESKMTYSVKGNSPVIDLQQPSSSGQSLYFADGTSLRAMNIANGSVTSLFGVNPQSSVVARPLSLGGCVYGAWGGSTGLEVRQCTGGSAVPIPIKSVLNTPVFRTNNGYVVLNDTSNGDTWDASNGSVLLNEGDWKNSLSSTLSGANNSTQGQNTGIANKPQVANVNATLRIGRSSVVYPLDHASDPSGGTMSIESVVPGTGSNYSIAIAPDGQSLLVTLSNSFSGSINSQFTVTDSNGASASAQLTISPTTAETAPFQLAVGGLQPQHVSSGSNVTVSVLSNWRDNEGDPIAIADVTSNVGTVTWTPSGEITFNAPKVVNDTPAIVTYVVTDGSMQSAGKFTTVVLGEGDLNTYPPIAQANSIIVTVGRNATLNPLANAIVGADPIDPLASLALASIPQAPASIRLTSDTTTGATIINATSPGVFSIPYTVSYGNAATSNSTILVVAKPPTTTLGQPIVMPSTILLHGSTPGISKVLSNAFDPSGSVLSVVSVVGTSSISAQIINDSSIRVFANSPNVAGPQVVTFTVTDGVTPPVTGELIVDWLPQLAPLPPIVPNISVNVRAGDYTNIEVLKLVTDPSGNALAIVPNSITIKGQNGQSLPPSQVGTTSIVGDAIRYVAPAAATVKSVVRQQLQFSVEDSLGEVASGTAYVTLVPVSAQNSPPNPPNLTERLRAGGQVTINIPTTNVDPNGDSTTVTGIASPPSLGRILKVTADSIVYSAYPLSQGTDHFSYTMSDRFGAVSTGNITIGVIAPQFTNPPIALPQFFIAPPKSSFTFDVTNFVAGQQGSSITLLPLSKYNKPLPAGLSQSGTFISLKAGKASTLTTYNYAVTNGVGTPSSSTITVLSSAGATLSLSAIDQYASTTKANQSFASVNLLAGNVDPASLALKVIKVFAPGVKVNGSNATFALGANPQSVAYEIGDSAGRRAIGVVHLPTSLALPHLISTKNVISVPVNGKTTIDINKYISANSGTVSLESTSAIYAAPNSNISVQATSYSSLAVSSSGSYTGPASLTALVVTKSASKALQSLVTIPVQVGANAPILKCPATTLQVTQGGSSISSGITNLCSLWTPPNINPASVTFDAKWLKQIPNVNLSLDSAKQSIMLQAQSSSTPNATGVIELNAAGSTVTSQIDVSVVAAGPATLSPITISGATAGSSTTVDISQYMQSPLNSPTPTVIGVKEDLGNNISATTSGSKFTLTIPQNTHGTFSFTLTATDLPSQASSRTITGTVTMTVMDLPGSITNLQGSPGDQSVALNWGAAPNNGAPVDYYSVSINGQSGATTTSTSYNATGLTNGQSYTFAVTAHNQLGNSPQSVSGSFIPQAVPGAPGTVTATPSDKSVSLSWGAANSNGDTVTYLVSLSPAPSNSASSTTTQQTSYTWNGLDNNVGPYTFTVTPTNKLGPGPSVSSSAVYTFSQPATPIAPTVVASTSPDQSSTTVVVSTPVTNLCNDARPCASDTFYEYKNGSLVQNTGPTTTPCSSGSGICATFGPLTNDGSSYTYAVGQSNIEGQASAIGPQSSPAVKAVGIPAAITDLSATPTNQSETIKFTIPVAHGASIAKVDYTLVDQSTGSTSTGSFANPGSSGSIFSTSIPNLTNGQTYVTSLVACNEVGECSQASNQVSAIPYGPPTVPQLNVSSGTDSINLSWSGGYNGRPITYNVYVDGVLRTQTGSATSQSFSEACSSSHNAYVSVTDSLGETTNGSNQAVSPNVCSPPSPPSVQMQTSGAPFSVDWGFSGGGGQGLPVTYYHSIDNGGYVASGPESTTQSFYSSGTFNSGCDTTHTIRVYVQDSAGQDSSVVTASATTPLCQEVNGGTIHSVCSGPSTGTNCSAGPAIAAYTTVTVQCAAHNGGYVANSRSGNYNWYLLSSPDSGLWTSADPYYNNGSTSGSLTNTPLVDPQVPTCPGYQ